jgi:hypothetical protein
MNRVKHCFFELALTAQFQREGVQSFSKYWGDLMAVIAPQSN